MARIRTIKPEFFTSEDIVGLSPLARLLYIAVWCESDREGRLAWKPKTFKMRYFPADDCDIDALAREVIASGLVVEYGDGLAFVPTFSRHQHVNPREQQSTLPPPPDAEKRTRRHASARVSDEGFAVSDAQVGREGREGTKSKSADKPADKSRGAENPKSADPQPADPIFGAGLDFLVRKGNSEKTARGFLGLIRKTVGDDVVVAELLAAAERADVSEPVAWLRKAAEQRKAQADAKPRQVSGLFPPAPEPATPRRREFGK